MNTTGRSEDLNPGHASYPEVIKLDQSFFPRPWKEDDWDSLNWDHHRLWGWFRNERLIGFSLFATNDLETAHLLKILIIPELRGSGEALSFWNETIHQLRQRSFQRVYLEVEESNVRARSFYEKRGFITLRSVKNYYSDGEGARMMQLTL